MIFTKNASTEEPIGLKKNPITSDFYVVQTVSPAKEQIPPDEMNEMNEE